ncbi:MAG: response regulator [Bacteroidetes bacterium]|jgi:DNA-binding NtrC family response regulator|nr:response regulator [Bacteroidota bacterium]
MAAAALRVFVVEDDPDYAATLRLQLTRSVEADVHRFETGEEALDALDREPDLVLLDLVMPGQGGIATLKALRAQRPHLPVVIVSAQRDIDTAIEAINLGAYDYVTKGRDDTVKIRALAERIAERVALTREVETLRNQLPARDALDGIVGESPEMGRVFKLIQKTLRGDLTVAIMGESGTGKELVAKAIHQNSARKRGPFVVVNCAAIPRELMESEFFGHEKGSFTGAHARKIGTFEQADGGTLFLDEVGELDLDLQAKLLRALQNREITRVGGNETITFDARIISATNKNVTAMVQEGTFREDLYYRLFQFPIQLPPLRDRGQDVLLLAESFRRDYLRRHDNLENRSFAAATRRHMLHYAWPGNVRELKSAVERALLISETPELMPEDLLLDVGSRAESSDAAPAEQVQDVQTPDDIMPLEDLKQLAVQHAYDVCEGNIEKTATHLGVARSTVYRVMRKMEENDAA